MSVDAIVWAKRQRTGSAAMKALLFVLADYADENGSCFPSQQRLADETEQSVRTVRDQLRKLAEMGLIRIQAGAGSRSATGGRKSNRYFLALEKPATLAANPDPRNRGLEANQDRGLPAKSGGGYRQPVAAEPSVEPPVLEPPVEQHPSPGGDDATDGALFVVEAPTGTRAERTAKMAENVSALGQEFEERFWPLYPRKVGKLAAQHAFARARRKGASLEDLIAGVTRYAKTCAGKDARFIAHAATWLNAGRWMDEEDPAVPAGAAPKSHPWVYRDEDHWSTG